MLRLIACDLDGTLLSGGSNLPGENIRALRRAADAGVKVTICTGRMIEATLPLIRQLGCVNAPVSLFNGAMVYDPAGDEVLSGTLIPCAQAKRILEAIEAEGIYVQAFPGRGYFYEARTDWSSYYENKIGVTGRAVGRKLSDWLETDVFKLLVLAEKEQADALQRKLAPLFPDTEFVKSAPVHLEIVARGVDKGRGLRDVCAAAGVPCADALAFGDEMNDLPMLLAAGTAYAMENSAPGVLKAIARIAPRNTDCGVARIVNLFLSEGRM